MPVSLRAVIRGHDVFYRGTVRGTMTRLGSAMLNANVLPAIVGAKRGASVSIDTFSNDLGSRATAVAYVIRPFASTVAVGEIGASAKEDRGRPRGLGPDSLPRCNGLFVRKFSTACRTVLSGLDSLAGCIESDDNFHVHYIVHPAESCSVLLSRVHRPDHVRDNVRVSSLLHGM